ncbi:MAG: LemA family protein [Verrucomicrobiota bacterium JB023]|nr:LemA family protein [Verrucomicrobiota bacterium JB023]
MKTFLLILVLIAIPVLVVIAIYNGFISRRNDMRNAFASIDVQLKKRWDLIPNLVETVKGYAEHERETYEKVINARNSARDMKNESPSRFAKENEISEGVGRLLAVAESYPELRSSEHFLNLQRNLTEIESQISAARRAYNAAVKSWNNGIETFPGSFFASLWDFKRADWFEVATAEEREPVKVEMS